MGNGPGGEVWRGEEGGKEEEVEYQDGQFGRGESEGGGGEVGRGGEMKKRMGLGGGDGKGEER